MKYLLRYTMAAKADVGRLRALFPAHQALWGRFRDDGTLLAIGPMENPADGALGVFTTREAAGQFAAADPFVLEGLVGEWTITGWREALL
jgi:uncharacterized protein